MRQSRSGRVIGIFGLPCSGKTTLAKAIAQSSKEIIAHISTGDIVRKISTNKEIIYMSKGNLFPNEEKIRNEVLQLIDKRRAQGAEVILLDGFPRFADQVKWMIEQQWIGAPGDGCLVQVVGGNLEARAKERNRDDQDSLELLQKKFVEHRKMIDGMEKLIFIYGITYYTVVNEDLLFAAKHFAKLIGLRK